MTFTLTDVMLLVIVSAFAIGGFFAGFIRSVGAILGFFAGAYMASRYFMGFGDWITPIIGGHDIAAKIIAFIVIFLIVDRLIALLFYFIGKLFGLISFIPFLKTINRIAGFLLGLTEGVLVTGLLIYIIAKIAPQMPFVADHLAKSQIANYLVAIVAYLTNWALPEAIIGMGTIFK